MCVYQPLLPKPRLSQGIDLTLSQWSDFQEFVRKPDTPKDFGDRMISDSATLSGELSAVIDVARSQKRYIKDLQEFLARLGPGPNHPNGSLQLSSQPSERGNMILTKINFILEERQTFLDEVNEIFLEVKAIEKSVMDTSITKQFLCDPCVNWSYPTVLPAFDPKSIPTSL